jgi:hypothetical protein
MGAISTKQMVNRSLITTKGTIVSERTLKSLAKKVLIEVEGIDQPTNDEIYDMVDKLRERAEEEYKITHGTERNYKCKKRRSLRKCHEDPQCFWNDNTKKCSSKEDGIYEGPIGPQFNYQRPKPYRRGSRQRSRTNRLMKIKRKK